MGYWVFLTAFLFLFINSFIFEMSTSTNPLSRLIPVERFLNTGSISLDGSPYGTTVDSARIKGKMYSDKPALLTFLLIGVSWVIQRFSGLDIIEDRRVYVWILLMLFNIIPYLTTTLLAYVYSRWFSKNSWARFYLSICLTFGMLPFIYSLAINNHTIASACVLAAFLLTHYTRYSMGFKREVPIGMALAIGLLSGLATSFEFTSGVFQLIFIGLLFSKDKKMGVISALTSALPVLVNLYYYYAIGGSIVPFFLRKDMPFFQKELYELYNYPGSYWLAPKGVDAYDEKKHIYFFHMLFGIRGLFLFTPFLLISCYGLYQKIFTNKYPDRQLCLLSALAILTIILFIGFCTNNYGGVCIGMRWLIVFMPLLTWLGLPAYGRISLKYKAFLIFLWFLGFRILTFALQDNGVWKNYNFALL